MAEIVWGAVGQRFYESGVDRGVLYPRNGNGVPWDGLISVDESPDGGTPTAFYADGYKYLNLASAEEFKANVTAYSAPVEFGRCDGTHQIHKGLFVTQQRREPFNFSYRTKIGNDVDGLEHGYKIHLVYNALASPTSRANKTQSDSPEAINLSWEITTTPPDISGYRPSAHFVVDSRLTPEAIFSQFEAMIYGTVSTEPFMPTIGQVMELFDSLITIELLQDKGNDIFEFEQIPAVRHSLPPIPAPGQSVLWLDTSAGSYAKLTLVTGE